MSVQALVWVLEHSQAEHSARLVLISLANHAGGDGGDSFPSIGTIAKESKLGERTVQGAIADLLEIGEIIEVGVSRYRTRAFRLPMTPAESAPPQNLHPRRMLRSDPAESAPEPSLEPSTTPPPSPPGGRGRDRRAFREELQAAALVAVPQLARAPNGMTAIEQAVNAKQGESWQSVARFVAEWWPGLAEHVGEVLSPTP